VIDENEIEIVKVINVYGKGFIGLEIIKKKIDMLIRIE
jgi:hypothetical protein